MQNTQPRNEGKKIVLVPVLSLGGERSEAMMTRSRQMSGPNSAECVATQADFNTLSILNFHINNFTSHFMTLK